MGEKLKLKVNIAGRQYPMSVNEDEEEIIRNAGKQINDMIREFELKYDIRDKQDALAMCALQIFSKSIEKDHSGTADDEAVKSRLQGIIDQLHGQLNLLK